MENIGSIQKQGTVKKKLLNLIGELCASKISQSQMAFDKPGKKIHNTHGRQQRLNDFNLYSFILTKIHTGSIKPIKLYSKSEQII